MKGTVHYEVRGNVALMTIDNPPVTPLSSGVRQGLHDGLTQALADDAVAAIVLTGAGRAFLAGATALAAKPLGMLHPPSQATTRGALLVAGVVDVIGHVLLVRVLGMGAVGAAFAACAVAVSKAEGTLTALTSTVAAIDTATATAAAATPRSEPATTATRLSIPPTLDLIIQDQIYTRFKIKDGIRRQ